MPSTMEMIASVLFAIAVIHTFSVPVFARLADRGGSHAGLWHLLSEVEAVFGVWACVLVAYIAVFIGLDTALDYMNTRNFTEPAFVFAIMVVAASRPVLELVAKVVNGLARVLPLRREYAMFLSLWRCPVGRVTNYRASRYDIGSADDSGSLLYACNKRHL